jgi:hypothetical protein
MTTPLHATITHGGTPEHCDRRPYPDRCRACPAMQWPHGGASADVMAAWVETSWCPHDDQRTATPGETR